MELRTLLLLLLLICIFVKVTFVLAGIKSGVSSFKIYRNDIKMYDIQVFF
jgi:hypothetical protein